MVLDPLTTLSVAGNVVQFADFGVKILTKGFELYSSVDGAPPYNRELEIIADDLKSLTARIRNSIWSHNECSPVTEEEQTLERLTKECDRVADTLLRLLESLKVQPKDKQRKWQSFHQALRSMWSAEKIDGIAKRLKDVRAQIDTHILADM